MLQFEIDTDLCPINQKYLSRRFILSKRYRESKERLSAYAKLYILPEDIFVGNLRLEIETTYPRKHDVDAFAKVILDSLNGIVYKDDGQISELLIKKKIVKGKSGAKITVIPLS